MEKGDKSNFLRRRRVEMFPTNRGKLGLSSFSKLFFRSLARLDLRAVTRW